MNLKLLKMKEQNTLQNQKSDSFATVIKKNLFQQLIFICVLSLVLDGGVLLKCFLGASIIQWAFLLCHFFKNNVSNSKIDWFFVNYGSIVYFVLIVAIYQFVYKIPLLF